MDSLLEVGGVTQRYGPVVGCENVSLSIAGGEVLGVLGQNGAGKSTLVKVLAGLVRPSVGRVRVEDRELRLGDPSASAETGIGVVHQHFSLVEQFTVWRNMALGERGRVDEQRYTREVETIVEEYGLKVDARSVVSSLTPAERQRVELVKALRRHPRVLVLDEPTSALTRQESRMLFEVLLRVVDRERCAVLLVSHRLEEVMHASDRVLVMRDGRVVFTAQTAETTVGQLAHAMVGRNVELSVEGRAIGVEVDSGRDTSSPGRSGVTNLDGPPALELFGAVVRGNDGRVALDELSLCVGHGEILGIAGVEGNGQVALVDLLSGLVGLEQGEVCIDGTVVRLEDGRTGTLPIGVVPSDRHDSGCVLDMSVKENLLMGHLDTVTRRGLLDSRRMGSMATQLVEQFDIKVGSVEAPMWSLSGGNQQKVVLARELARRPSVLVAAQPTHGLDVGAIEYFWRRLREAASAGTAVILISAELDEILALSDRIAVIYRGRITGEMARGGFDGERLGLLMGGQAA